MAIIRKRVLRHGKICWQVDYRDGKKKRRHKQFRTKGEANAWMVETLSAVLNGTHVAASDSKTVAEAAEEWLKDCERNQLERTTLDVYRQRVDDHVVPFIGHLKLAVMTTVDAQNFYECFDASDATVAEAAPAERPLDRLRTKRPSRVASVLHGADGSGRNPL
jgi:integrase